VSLKCFSVLFSIFASFNIFHLIYLLRRISVVLSVVTYRLFSGFYLMFVTVFTATLVSFTHFQWRYLLLPPQ